MLVGTYLKNLSIDAIKAIFTERKERIENLRCCQYTGMYCETRTVMKRLRKNKIIDDRNDDKKRICDYSTMRKESLI